MAALEFTILGTPLLRRRGRLVKIGRRKGMAILAYLAVTRQRQSRDNLLNLLWSDYEVGAGRANLRRDLNQLKQKVGSEQFLIDRHSVALHPEATLAVDLYQFQALVAESRQHHHLAAEICPACLDRLNRAAAIYAGDFMAGFEVPGEATFAGWQLFHASALRQELGSVLQQLIRWYEQAGELETALPLASRWVSFDGLNGLAQRSYIRLLAATGAEDEALEQYEASLRRLEQPLDVETRQLIEQIRSQGVTPHRATAKPPGAAHSSDVPAPIRHNLPVQLTPFVGRDSEMETLATLLRDPLRRLITILGPGGIGKSRLALAVAEAELPLGQFRDGIYFVSLAPVRETDHIVPTLAASLNYPLQRRNDPADTERHQIMEYLTDKRLLLVLDNFEHLLGAGELVAELLQRSPGTHIIVTSRERLGLQAENIFAIHGLPVPANEAGIAVSKAAELFLLSAERLHSGFQIHGEDRQHLLQICRLVDGMPLGLELAASWVGSLPLAAIVREISQSLDFLATAEQDRPARHHSINAVCQSSWQRLSEREQDLYVQFAVFRDGFSQIAGQAITGATPRELSRLCNKSLLSYNNGTRRYQIHELLRQFAAEKLAERPGWNRQTRDRHAAYYLGALDERAERIKGDGQQQALQEIAGDIENARAAWQWCVTQGQIEMLGQALDVMGYFSAWQGRFEEGLRLFELLEARLSGGPDASALWRAVAWRCLFTYYRGDAAAAEAALLAGLRTIEAGETGVSTQVVAFIHLRLGEIMLDRDNDQARTHFGKSRALYRQIGWRWEMSQARQGAGHALWLLGEFELARRELNASLAIRRELQDKLGLVAVTRLLSTLARYSGNGGDALYFARECLANCNQLENPLAIASARSNLAVTEAIYQNRLTEALLLQQQTIESYEAFNAVAELGFAYGIMAMFLVWQGEFAQADSYAQKGLAIAERVDQRYAQAYLRLWQGIPLVGTARRDEADRLLAQSAAIYAQAGIFEELFTALCWLTANRVSGEGAELIQRRLVTIVAHASENNYFYSVHFAMCFISLLLLRQNDENARSLGLELYGVATSLPGIEIMYEQIPALQSFWLTVRPEEKMGLPAKQAWGRRQDIWRIAEETLVRLPDLGWPEPYDRPETMLHEMDITLKAIAPA